MKDWSCMKVKVLIDNKTKEKIFKPEWGLSVYIEFENHKFLLDTGWHGYFASNAKKMGINLADVDYGILSHGHMDHANGLNKFFRNNKTAKFYLQNEAGGKYYSDHHFIRMYIGIKKSYLRRFANRFEYVKKYQLCPNVYLLPHSTPGLEEKGKAAWLYVKRDGKLKGDDFRHEQSLIFDTPNGLVIMNSCSHAGADVIIKEAQKEFPGKKIHALLGGFHLAHSSDEEVRAFGNRLKELEVDCIYTGHCTGDKAFQILHEMLGDKVQQLYTGMEIEL